VSYQQTFTLHTTDRPTQEEQGESDSGSILEPGCTIILASYPALLTPAFVTCSTNAGEGLVKLGHVV